MIVQEDLNNRFAHHPPKTQKTAEQFSSVRGILLDAASKLVAITPTSREQSLMVTKLEEAMFHANAAIARNQA